MLATNSVQEFLNSVASNSPAPGGGSVSALAAALGTALTSMVCRLTIGKKKYEGVQEYMMRHLATAEELRAKLTDLIDQDTEAFSGVMKAFAMAKETEEQKRRRSNAIQEATRQSTLVPLEMMRLGQQAFVTAKAVAMEGNVNSVTDAGVAVLMIYAGCVGAAMNVRINLATLQDQSFVQATASEVSGILQRIEEMRSEALARVDSVLG